MNVPQEIERLLVRTIADQKLADHNIAYYTTKINEHQRDLEKEIQKKADLANYLIALESCLDKLSK